MRKISLGTVGTVVATALAIGLGLSARSNAAYADALVTAPLGAFVDGCTHHCRTCGTDKHDIVVHYSQNNHSSSHLENCNTGSCSSHSCNESLASSVQDLWSDVQRSDGTQLREILQRHSDVAEYNEERAAVQFRCSAGNIVASLPLTPRQVEALE